MGQPSSDVRKENVLDDKAPAFPILLPDAAKEAFSTVLDRLRPICKAYDVDSHDVVEFYEDVVCDSL